MPSPASTAGSHRFMPGSPRGRRSSRTVPQLRHQLRARASTAAPRSALCAGAARPAPRHEGERRGLGMGHAYREAEPV